MSGPRQSSSHPTSASAQSAALASGFWRGPGGSEPRAWEPRAVEARGALQEVGP
jgi:hypothetical protein